ncbi:hypothetical protein DRO33_04665 [Candidatus Bathyarchaeota archaeon]|nr:MAG: hypothetical protein DRO33_04665 [Candidatus Bathyarchaeota archaeon]
MVADATALPFRDGVFDVANISAMLHHHPGLLVGAILSEVARVLGPGGLLIIREPCPCDEGRGLADEVEDLFHDLRALEDIVRSGGRLDELRPYLYLASGVFGFGSIYPAWLKGLLAERGFSILRAEVQRAGRDYDGLLRRAEEMALGLPLDEDERAYLLARIGGLREKAKAVELPSTCRLFLVAEKAA